MNCICLEKAFERALVALKEKKTARECIENAFQIEIDRKYPFTREALKYTRKTLMGMNQMDAAELLGVTWATWQCYEQGKLRMPSHRWQQWLNHVGEKKIGKVIKNKRTRV